MPEIMVLPYFGEGPRPLSRDFQPKIVGLDQAWKIRGNRVLQGPGWYRWSVQGRWAEPLMRLEIYEDFEVMEAVSSLKPKLGYLLGDRGLLDNLDPHLELGKLPRIWFIPPGLRKFTRARVGLWHDQEHLVFMGEEPRSELEDGAEVLLEDNQSVELGSNIPGITPQLRRTFRMEREIRAEVEERRRRAEEEERLRLAALAAAERERQLEEARKVAMATLDGRVKEALTSMGAELLSIREGHRKDEATIRYKYGGRRLECVVRKDTLGVIDSGICLTDHRTNTDYSQKLTLRALVGVVDDAIRLHKLVVWREG